MLRPPPLTEHGGLHPCLFVSRRGGDFNAVAQYEGPASIEWTKENGRARVVQVRCVCESFVGGLWQGQLLEFPDKVANIWSRAETLSLRLPDATPTPIRPTRVSSELPRPVALGFTGVGPSPFDGE